MSFPLIHPERRRIAAVLLFLALFTCGSHVQPLQAQTNDSKQASEGKQGGEGKQTNDGKYVPDIAKAAAAEGETAFRKKDYDRARRAYRKALDLAPDNLVALINLGVIEFYAGNNADAEKFLKRAVQLKLDTAPAWLTLGIIYMEDNKLEDALAALSQATLYDPGNARARNYLGVVVGRKGWIDGAQAELRKAVELDPSYSDAHYNLAVFYLESKPPSVELARRHYYRSLELGAEPDPEIEKTLNSGPQPKP